MRLDGSFLFRYRCFDILSQAHGAVAHPVLAECVGQSFRVYSTRSFPGLAPSTELTKVRMFAFDTILIAKRGVFDSWWH